MERECFFQLAREVIKKYEYPSFNSHEFLDAFRKQYPWEYISMLNEREKDDESPFRTTHAIIGNWLLDGARTGELEIEKTEDNVICKSVLGNEVPVPIWKRTKISNPFSKEMMAKLLILIMFFACVSINALAQDIEIDSLDMADFRQQRYAQGWEWIMKENDQKVKKTESYPYSISYYLFPSHPQYRLCYAKNYLASFIYDDNGTLLRVHMLLRCSNNENFRLLDNLMVEEKTSLRQYIMNQILIHDYKNNKYNIQKESANVQHDIKVELGLEKSQNEDEVKDYIQGVILKELCKSLNITYVPGMSQMEIMCIYIGGTYEKGLTEDEQAARIRKKMFAKYGETRATQILTQRATTFATKVKEIQAKVVRELYSGGGNIMTQAMTYGAAYAATHEKSTVATNYLKQLRSDHEDVVDNISRIVRLSETSFKLVFNDDPDCKFNVVITFKNKKPYEYACDFEFQVVNE
ncbi:MAG: hypothetical protein K5778_07535 [Bacteroidaceae bacterium]|nr:hypothetical protein [Bacteroidaceae bacterium]